MTNIQVKLVSQILKEHFGDVTKDVAAYILKKDFVSLRAIVKDTQIPLKKVKSALSVLVTRKLVTFSKSRQGVEYRFDMGTALRLMRHPRYLYCIKTLYGDEAEMIVEELLQQGEDTMTGLLTRVNYTLAESGQSSSVFKLRDVFTSLAQTHFIRRCPTLVPSDTQESVPTFNTSEDNMYTVPRVNLKESQTDDEPPPAKRSRTDSDKQETSDDGIYWMVDFERFDLYLRDVTLVSATTHKFNKTSGEILRTFLRLSEVMSSPSAPATNNISYNEWYSALPAHLSLSKSSFSQHLQLLVEDSTNMLEKVGESGGGMYCIDFRHCFTSLCRAHIESFVQEKFGSRSVRILRLLLMKDQLEQKQIEEFAMIPSKEAKELLYRLFSENLVSITEVPRSVDHAPSRTFYLFSVDLSQVTRMLLQHSYQMVYNLMLRREHEMSENKRVLDKQQRLEAIMASLVQSGADDAQRAEVEEMTTPSEKEQLNHVKHSMHKLEMCEVQLDEAIFVLEFYLKYKIMK